jgi:2-oxoglutarate dehydrogenase E2 component (dihydrolipoamide succinyltransferase)
VRRLLAEHGLEATAVHGTGQGGRVTVEDVLRAAAGEVQPASGKPAKQAPAAAEAGVRRVPHSAVRRRIAEHMVQSLLHTAPHVTTVFEADLTAVLEDRARRREAFAQRGVPLTLSAYFIQAAVAAIRVVPESNSRWTDAALEIYDWVHIGVATAVEGSGLLVPVLRDAHERDLFETARGLDDLVSRARAGTLTPADVRGGTFTISNHGVSGSLLAAPIIINQPQSAILGIGKLERRAVAMGDAQGETIVVRPRCYVTLTLDHRVMDGHQANRFMQVFVDTLSRWPS